MDFRTMTIDDIIDWCQKHHQVAWLKAEAKKTTECKIYPRVMVEKKTIDKDGNEVIKKTSKIDKTQPYTTEERPITFVQIKKDFAEKFMPEIIKGENKKPTMYERIALLQED